MAVYNKMAVYCNRQFIATDVLRKTGDLLQLAPLLQLAIYKKLVPITAGLSMYKYWRYTNTAISKNQTLLKKY